MKAPDGKIKDYIHVVTNSDHISEQIFNSLSGDFCYIRSRSVSDALSNMTFQTPSVIITEQNLPDMDAFEFVKTIRNSIKTKLIPFVVISETDTVEQRILAIECGVDAYLKYPFMPEELDVLVNSKISKFKEFYLLSVTDELTRLYNRREFVRKFNDFTSKQDPGVISLVILDLDFFKRVNDIYGHQIGDMVLMKIADMLKERTSDSFFPARFGGEEFVILLPGINSATATVIVKKFLVEFSSIIFDTSKTSFSITFSAGIAEFPEMALNISELLARADQALYAAKHDGRNRVYTFSPIMARNDRFWNHLNVRKSVFINELGNDPVTDLPFLPNALEVIMNLDYEVKSIGVLILKPRHIVDIQTELGLSNYCYDVENIKNIVKRSCEMIFPSDTYISLSEFYETEFAVIFPSVVDFTENLDMFNSICRDIALNISEKLAGFGVDLLYASNAAGFDENNPKNIMRTILLARNNLAGISDFDDRFNGFSSAFSSDIICSSMFDDLFVIKHVMHAATLEKAFARVAFIPPFEGLNLLKNFFEKISDKNLREFMKVIFDRPEDNGNTPVLMPWLGGSASGRYIDIIKNFCGDARVILMVNEHELNGTSDSLSDAVSSLPDNFSAGIRNVYVGGNILQHLSKTDFSLIMLSRNMIRNLHVFRDRIQVINGLKIFADQLSIPLGAMGVSSEEDWQVVRDLGITYVFGDFIENLLE